MQPSRCGFWRAPVSTAHQSIAQRDHLRKSRALMASHMWLLRAAIHASAAKPRALPRIEGHAGYRRAGEKCVILGSHSSTAYVKTVARRLAHQ